MSLATLTDVKRILRAVPPSGYPRIKIGSATTDDMTETDATSYLAAQESYIVSRIGFNPIATDKLMIEVHANLTAFQIYVKMMNLSVDGDIPEFVKIWNSWAESILDGINKGSIKIARTGDDASPLIMRSSNFLEQRWEEVTLTTTTEWVALNKERIISSTEKVESDKEDGTLYTRGTDYEISYKSGEIRRLDGAITEDQKVYISYFYIDKGTFHQAVDSIDWSNKRSAYLRNG